MTPSEVVNLIVLAYAVGLGLGLFTQTSRGGRA